MAEILRYERKWPLDDIVIRSGGDGRTVEAYAAIFDSPYPVRDQHGEYDEVVERSAFNKTLADGWGRVMPLYNHGMTVHGTPDMLGSVPLGTPLEIRPDGKGLLTVTRYNRSALADAVLEAIRNGDITSQSFRGRIVRSTPSGRIPRPRAGSRSTVVRHELGLSDYGPTPMAVNAGAHILAVRSLTALAEELRDLDEEARAELIRALSSTTSPGQVEPETTTATPNPGAGAEEPLDVIEHSGRLAIRRARLRMEAISRGVL